MNVLDYFPYGKISREYRAEGSERYLTTGHERDEETGLDNRGARWYDSDVARFLSIDPKAEQYANWSAYNYVLANPLLIVDPDGRGDVFMQLELNPAKGVDAGGGWFGGNGGGFSFPRMPLPTITVQEAEVVQTASQAMTPQYVAPPLAPPAPTLQPALVPVPAAPAATHPYEAAGKPGAYSVDADGNVMQKAVPSNTGQTQTSKNTNYLRQKGVKKAWQAEKKMVEETGEGTREWSPKEIDELKDNGKVKGYQGHHINSVKDNPNMADDPNNVEFLDRKEHLDAHGGNFRNPTSGDLKNRTPNP